MNKEEIIELDENDVQHLFDAGVNMAGEIKELENQIEHYRSTNIHLIDKNKYLQQENKKYKEVIDKISKHCEIEINASNHYLKNHSSQKELCHKIAHQRVLDILKEV